MTGILLPELKARQVDAGEIGGVRALFRSVNAEAAAAFGLSCIEFGRCVAIAAPGTQSAFFNRVLGLGVFEPASRSLVLAIVESYKARDTPFMVHVSPYAKPPTLSEWLMDFGLERSDDWIALWRDNKPIHDVTTTITIDRIDSRAGALFASTVCAAYGMPDEWEALFAGIPGQDDWLAYLAYDGTAPVGSGMLYVDDGAGWFAYGCTMPSYRGRGVQKALIARRLADGMNAGCVSFTGETWRSSTERENPSERNMALHGFETTYIRQSYSFRPWP